MRNQNIRWISPVDTSASIGGGVARAISALRSSELISNFKLDFYSLSSYKTNQYSNLLMQIKIFLNDILFLKYRNFFVHSFFSPYVLLLLIIPIKLNIILMPHGQLKFDALKVKSFNKKFVIALLKILKPINQSLKKITVIASNDEELEFVLKTVGVGKVKKIPDMVSKDMLLNKHELIEDDKGINLVIIFRLTKDKGVSMLLKEIIKNKKHEKKTWTSSIESISIFFIIGQRFYTDDEEELKNIYESVDHLKNIYKIKINIFEGLNHNEISNEIHGLPNKIGFIPSKFESFSYALIEQLNFEYCPIVWFKNDLVKTLVENEMCTKLKFGELLDDNSSSPIKLNIHGRASKFLSNSHKDIIKKYINVFEEIFKKL